MADNLVLGKGELYFSRYITGTETPEGERYLGNTPEFNITVESEDLPHYSSDRGIREKDANVVVQTTRTASLITDNIAKENLALFFFGAAGVTAISGATVSNESLGAVKKGCYYQIGASDANPAGLRSIVYPGTGGTAFALKKGSTVLVQGTDFDIEAPLGRILILSTSSTVSDGDVLTVSYTYGSYSEDRIISGSTPTSGQLRFIARNPQGANTDYLFPKVTLRPNGDFALKGEEWQQLPLNVEILRKTGKEAIYANGRPYNP